MADSREETRIKAVIQRIADSGRKAVPSPGKPSLRKRHKQPFAAVDIDEIACFGCFYDPVVALHLEAMRTAGLRSTLRQDGWGQVERKRLTVMGIANRDAHYRAARRLQALGVIEIRSRPGCKLEYRLNPNWAKPKAEVVDLAAMRKLRKRAR
jgi:hypothetical protein